MKFLNVLLVMALGGISLGIGTGTDIFRPILLSAAESGNRTTQCGVGACHIFAVQRLFEDATDLKLSTSRLFADHMAGDDKLSLLEKEMSFITGQRKKISQVRASKKLESEKDVLERKILNQSPRHEAGSLFNDLELLRKLGGSLVNDDRDWTASMSSIRSLQKERVHQITTESPVSDDRAKERILHYGGQHILEKSSLLSTRKPDLESAGNDVDEFIKSLAKNLQIKEIIHPIMLAQKFSAMLQRRKRIIIEELKKSAPDCAFQPIRTKAPLESVTVPTRLNGRS